jgi:hypothetical protein
MFLAGQDDELVKMASLPELAFDWLGFLMSSPPDGVEGMQRHECTGRP